MKIVKYVMTIAVPEDASEDEVITEVLDMFRSDSPDSSECAMCSAELVKMEGEK